MKVTLPAGHRLIPAAEPVDYSSQPSAQAIDHDRSRHAAQHSSHVAGLECAPVRRPPSSMIEDPRRPLGVGRGVGHRSGCDVGDLGTVREQCLAVTGLPRSHASGDKDAVIRPGEVGIDQRGHHR
jgi:hypothetical protein